MKTFSNFLWIAVAAVSVTFTSCGDDGTEPDSATLGGSSINRIFPMGIPATVNNYSIELNEQGKVVKMSTSNNTEVRTFEYGDTLFNNDTCQAIMKINYSNISTNEQDIYLKLNKRGFITSAVSIRPYHYNEVVYKKWEFEYNSNGQLSLIRRTDNAQEIDIKYKRGDIIKVTRTNSNGNVKNDTIVYTNSEYQIPIANRGGIMPFSAFDITIDEIELTYYAGLLGLGTNNLPMAITSKWDYEVDEHNAEYHWDFDESKYLPIKFYSSTYNFEHNISGLTFNWNRDESE